MKVSIIVPVYNAEMFLKRCIESLLNQEDYVEYEIILVDDGSTDNSGEICEEYAKKFNKITVIHKKNEGVSKARNLGINNAKGDYITFVDSDDFVNKDMLKNFYNTVKISKSDMIFFGHNNININTNKVISYKAKKIINTKLDSFLRKDFIYYYKNFLLQGPFNKFYKKEIIDSFSIRFDESLRICEDAMFVIDFLKKSVSISSIEGCYYNYMQNGTENTLIRQFNVNEVEANWELYEDFLSLFEKQELYKNEIICVKEDFLNRFIVCLKKMFLKSKYSKERLICELKKFINDERLNEFKEVKYNSNLLNRFIYVGIKYKSVYLTYVCLKVYKMLKEKGKNAKTSNSNN